MLPKLAITTFLSLISTSDGFTFAPYTATSLHKTPITFSPAARRTISNPYYVRIRPDTFLSAEESDGDEDVTAGSAEVKEEEGAVVEPEAPKEDPEVTSLKEEISKLESQLKSKKLQLNRVKDEIDDYTEKGYLRKCAEMDNVRRMRAAAQSNNLESSRATVIQDFLPVLDALRELDVIYAGDDFAKSYSALRWDFENSLKSFSFAEFSVATGEALDKSRMFAAGEEYSDEVAKGTVIREISPGMEVSGNVIRMSKCVVSLGSEAEAIKEAEEKAKAEAQAKAEAEGGTAETAEAEAE